MFFVKLYKMRATYLCQKKWREANPDKHKEQKHKDYLKTAKRISEWNKIIRQFRKIQWD